MAIPSSGNTYRFKNYSSSNFLNSNSQNSPYNGGPVSTMTRDGTWEQNWYYDGDRLYTEWARTTYCLDRYVTNNKADIWQVINTTTGNANQQISFEAVSGANNTCYIRLANAISGSVYYLKGGSPCTWVTTKTNDTKWIFDRVRRITNMPNISNYNNQVEFFHPNVAPSTSTWPSTYTTNIKNFYKYIYNDSSTVPDSKCMYNLCGSLMFNTGNNNINGKFHAGVDMYHGGSIRAPFSGKVYKNPSIGMVSIYNAAHGYTFTFLHMTSLTNKTSVNKGDIIGVESNVGTISQHLHVELHSGDVSTYSVATPSSNESLGMDGSNGTLAIIPYGYMGTCLSWT